MRLVIRRDAGLLTVLQLVQYETAHCLASALGRTEVSAIEINSYQRN